MFCNNCGRALNEGENVCQQCGFVMETNQTASGVTVVQPVSALEQQPVVQEQSNQTTTAQQTSKPEQQASVSSQQPQPQWTPASEQALQNPAEVQARDKISEFQRKLDESDNKFLKGRSVLDIAGLIVVAGMLFSLFMPWVDISLSYSSWTFVSQSYSVLNISELTSLSSGLSGATNAVIILYFLPIVYALVDLLVVKENSSRHIRLIVTSIFNFVLIGFIGTIVSMLGSSVSLAAGFYVACLFTLGLAIVGLVGIIQKAGKSNA